MRLGVAKVKARPPRLRRAPGREAGGVTHDRRALLATFAVLCVAVFALAGRQLEAPGLYYDEAIQALPAAEFLREDGRPLDVPGAVSTWLLGGWFPLMTQPYMGALKSQLLIPIFSAGGVSIATLRLTTLAWACVGLLFLLLWAARLFGAPAACIAAALLALDPSFLFVSRHDWGSVALAFALRMAGLWLLTEGWLRGSRPRLLAGGLLLGLGVFNKIDFSTFLAGSAAAAALTLPGTFWRTLRARPARGLAAAAGLLAGAAPMLWTLPGVLGATRAMLRSQQVRPSDLGEKLQTWATFLDGSHFHRLMLSGGSFERLGAVEGAAGGPFAWLLAAAALFLAVRLLAAAQRGEADRAEAFLWIATVATALALLAVPRAARIHHVMNVQPLPQLLVAVAAVRLWTQVAHAGRGSAALACRSIAVLAVALGLLGSLRIDLLTLETIRSSGGRGRWSGALLELARELPEGSRLVSLDWGFHAPLRLLHPELELSEPVWSMARSGGPFALAGGPRHLYLVQEPGFEVFGMGDALLEAVAALPPGQATVRTHTDREGAAAFRSIRFARPHQLVYRGSFEVKLR